MKRNLVEPDPGVNERENMERTVQNLGNLRQTIRTVLGTKARTSRIQVLELDDTIHGLFVEVEQILRERGNQGPGGTLPLLLAARMGDANRVEELLRGGANISERNERGQTALHIAIQRSELEVVRILTRNGADLEARDQAENTPLHSLDYNHLSSKVKLIAQCLLEAGVQIEARGADDSTPLHRATSLCQPVLVDLLLLHGADVNSTKGLDRLTPLHLACSSMYAMKIPVLKCLLEANADIHATSRHGNTPFDFALQSLLTRERKLAELEPADGLLTSTIFHPCSNFRASVETIAVLLDQYDALNLNARSRTVVNTSFLFRDLRAFAGLRMRDARVQFRELRIFVLLGSDADIYRAVKFFHNPPPAPVLRPAVDAQARGERGRGLRNSRSFVRSSSTSSGETVRGEPVRGRRWWRIG